MTPGFVNIFKGILSLIVFAICIGSSSLFAQTTLPKSRVAVVANEAKTNIWVSDFPKQTSIIIYDTENNLLSITSTNSFGAAFISLPKGIKTGIVVKTVDGEVSASNKSVIKNKQEEQNVVATYQEEQNKA